MSEFFGYKTVEICELGDDGMCRYTYLLKPFCSPNFDSDLMSKPKSLYTFERFKNVHFEN